jgi:hypothetical protein
MPVGTFVETHVAAVNALPDRSFRRCDTCLTEFVAFVADSACRQCGAVGSTDIARLFHPGA